MKKTIFTMVASAMLMPAINAQTAWKVDVSHSKVGFSVTHMMVSDVDGLFRVFQGEASSKSDMDFSGASISFTADASSINTNDEKRDGHLRGADFLDTERFPNITFTSVSVKPDGKIKTSYIMEGDLTMHGVTKRVKLNAIGASRMVQDPWGNTKYGFRISGTLNRKDFGLVWNKALDAGGVAVSDEVAIACNIELNKNK